MDKPPTPKLTPLPPTRYYRPTTPDPILAHGPNPEPFAARQRKLADLIAAEPELELDHVDSWTGIDN